MPARRHLAALALLPLLAASCGGDDGGEEAGRAGPAEPVTELTITSRKTSFDITSFKVPAGEEITITYDNQHRGVTHNISFEDVDGAETPLNRGPATDEVTFTAPDAGEHEFICVVHPSQMKGTMTVVD